jgi:hypothetical protein
MTTDKCPEHVLDGAAVIRRILGDASQRVQTADAHIKILAAQLIDGTAEPVGDLAFAADVDLPPRCYRAGHHQQPAKGLQDGRSRVVGELGLGLLELDTGLCAQDAVQICGAQGRVVPPGDDDDADEQDGRETAPREHSEPESPLVRDGRSPSDTVSRLCLAVKMGRREGYLLAVRLRRFRDASCLRSGRMPRTSAMTSTDDRRRMPDTQAPAQLLAALPRDARE